MYRIFFKCEPATSNAVFVACFYPYSHENLKLLLILAWQLLTFIHVFFLPLR